MKKTTILISWLLLSFVYFNCTFATDEDLSIVTANSSLSFAQPNISITVAFDREIDSVIIQNIKLSNSASFTPSFCTFDSLAFTAPSLRSSIHNLTIGLFDGNEIKRAIGNNPSVECLSDSNSTNLELLIVDPLFLLTTQLNVTPDLAPPQVNSFEINFHLRIINIIFSEPIIVGTLNVSEFIIRTIGSLFSFPLSNLTNSAGNNPNNSNLSSENYVIVLEVFELSLLSSQCRLNSPCSLELPANTSIASDVFGNILVNPSPNVLPVSLVSLFVRSDFSASSLSATPVNSKQVNLTFSVPANLRPSDEVYYRVFVYRELAKYYHGDCAFVYGYRNQLGEEKPAPPSTFVCQNSTESLCYITQESSLLVDIIVGFDTLFRLDTVYQNIQFNDSTNDFISISSFYQNLLDIQFFQREGVQEIFTALQLFAALPFPLGNRALLTWKVPNLSFCNEHRITLRYPTSTIDLNDETVCGAQFVYVYLPNGEDDSLFVEVEVRILSPNALLPNNTCAFASIPIIVSGIGLSNFAGVDIPVVESISSSRPRSLLDHFITWSNFPLSTMDFFNIYVFPVYALRHDGGSCNTIDSQTSDSEFSFYPTEYYKYGVSIPSQLDFNLSCPASSDLSLPYQCYSAFSDDRRIELNLSTQFAVGVIVEAVFFSTGSGVRIKTQSYPAIYSSWTINQGSVQGNTYQQISWNTFLCPDSMSSVLFRVYEFNQILTKRRRSISIDIDPFLRNYIIPCTNPPALITELPLSFTAVGYLFNDLQIRNRSLCLSGFESTHFDRFGTDLADQNGNMVLDFEFRNYFTISMSISINGNFNQPASIYLFPFLVNSLTINATQSDICPAIVNGFLPDEYYISLFQVNVSSLFSSPLPCVNTSSYSCVFVENTLNLTFNVTPGFDNMIIVNTTSQLLSFVPGSTNSMTRIPTLRDRSVLGRQRVLYTSVRLLSNNSILVEWDAGFYCPPDSYMSIYIEVENELEEDILLMDEVNTPCQVGYYMIQDPLYSAYYYFDGDVFFNSTVVIPSCPTLRLQFDSVKTSEFIQKIELIDFENVYVEWDSVAGVSSYTLLAVPDSISFFQDAIGSVYTSTTRQFLSYSSASSVPLNVIFQMCLNSSESLTCSKLTTSNTNAIITVLPGYEYKLAVAYDIQNVTTIQPESSLELSLRASVPISEFNRVVLYNFNEEICTSDVRTVSLYASEEINLIFRVNPYQNSTTELSIADIPFVFPHVLFLFPYQEVEYPGMLGLLIPPATVTFRSQATFSRLPGAAAPALTSILPPMDSNSNLYQAEWTGSPNLPIAQGFESYTLFALPYSRNFTLSGEACPVIVYPGCFFGAPLTPLRNRSLIFDLCPYSRNFYFCQEFSTAVEGQIALFPLLDYLFFVESQYDGGLRAYFIEDGINVLATQDLMESLDLNYQVTTVSIEIQWDTSAAFCVDSTLAFLYSTQIDPSISIACQIGNYSIGSLQPNTEYEILFHFDYNPTRLHPGPDQCIRSVPLVAFDPFPVTSSICLTQQPCAPFGLCSEGFSNDSIHCDCLTGYEFDGNTCIDTNECNTNMNPCNNGFCVNTEGSFTCICYEGFQLVNSQCVDVNECDTPDSCINGLCVNLLPPANYRCECEPLFQGRICNISVETSTCPSFTEPNELGNNITFPATPRGEEALVSCSQLDITLFGNISKLCNDELEWEATNFDACLGATFLALQVSRTQAGGVLSPEESISQSMQLASATNEDTRVLFPGEINEAVVGLETITNSLVNLTGEVLASTLARVQENVVVIASNIFRSDNMDVILASPQIQTQSVASVVVLSVETLGTLLGSVLPVNSSLVIDSTNVALVVAVVSNPDEPFEIGPTSTSRSDSSALVRAQASVSIPVSVIRANDIGGGVEVSFSVYPNLAQLLGQVAAEVPLTGRETSINDTLGTGISNLNIFSRGGGRVEELSEDILLTFGLLFDPPIIGSNIKFRIVYSCVSSRVLDNGWISSGTSLSNEEQVPPGPAQCSVSHLTNFAVLVSARSLNFTPEEVLGLEILSYLTGILSILFLLISIASYVILWWRTRKQRTSLFKKDATILHFNFAVSLLLALIFFMASAGAYENRKACLAMTIIQYYFWLSVFTSSLSIGVYLLIKIFAWNVERRFWHFLVILSWSLPIPLLIITPSITHSYMIDDVDEICWLSNEPKYASLAFIIPMILITGANLIILIITSIVLFRISKGNKNMYLQVRSVLFAALLLAPLLGIPWLFSIVASLPTPATAFIFTVVLGLQGVLFSILYPLRTPEIIKYVFLWKPVNSNQSLPKYSSSNTGTNPTGPSALKFRINRKGENTISENIYSQTKPSVISEAGEARNELDGIKLEPVTIESSMRSLSAHPNLNENDIQKGEKLNVELDRQFSESHYTKSLPTSNDEFQGSLSINLPYQSLTIDETDQQ